MRHLLLLLLLCIMYPAWAANAVDKLNRFHAEIKSLRADFSQQLRDNQQHLVQESQGIVWIKRPGKFRWEYRKPFPQTIVADGKHIWIHDPELEQVTVKNQQHAIANAPALVLSGTTALAKDFIISEDPRDDGLDWVRLEPRQEDTDFSGIAVAFNGDELAMLELQDNLGQRTRIRFENLQVNSGVDSERFKFEIPPGTDIIGPQE